MTPDDIKPRLADVPKPGSTKARDQGCTCPVMDNHHGEGFRRMGEQLWWIDSRCRMHGMDKP
jgi:hypothetical protein